MNESFSRLVFLERLAREAHQSALQVLEQARRDCAHAWDSPQGSIRTPGYMARDWMAHYEREVWVEPTEKPQWTRTCLRCGVVEHTQQATPHVTHTPVFSR